MQSDMASSFHDDGQDVYNYIAPVLPTSEHSSTIQDTSPTTYTSPIQHTSPTQSALSIPTDGSQVSGPASTHLPGISSDVDVVEHEVPRSSNLQPDHAPHTEPYNYQYRHSLEDGEVPKLSGQSENPLPSYHTLQKYLGSYRHWYESTPTIQSIDNMLPWDPASSMYTNQPLSKSAPAPSAVPIGLFKNVHPGQPTEAVRYSLPAPINPKKHKTTKPVASKTNLYKRNVDKPPYTYAALIIMAIQQYPGKAATLIEIRAKLAEMFPFFRGEYKGWKSSVRHALSDSKCFFKSGEPVVIANAPSSKWSVDWTLVSKTVFHRQNKPGSETFKSTLYEELNLPEPKRSGRSKFADKQQEVERPTTITPDMPEKASTHPMRLPHVPCYSSEPATAITLGHSDDFLQARKDSEERPHTASSTDSVCKREIDADIMIYALPSYVIDADTTRSDTCKRKRDPEEEMAIALTQQSLAKRRRHQITKKIFSNINQTPDATTTETSLGHVHSRPTNVQQTQHTPALYGTHDLTVPSYGYNLGRHSGRYSNQYAKSAVNTLPAWNEPGHTGYSNNYMAGNQHPYMTSPYFYNAYTGRWQYYDAWTAHAYAQYNQMSYRGNNYGYGQSGQRAESPINLSVVSRCASTSSSE